MQFSSATRFAACLAALVCLREQQLPAQEFEFDFEAARTLSVKADKSILAVVTASDWTDGSRIVAQEHLKNRRFTETFRSDHVLMHVDYVVKKDGAAAEEARSTARINLERLGIRRMELLPCAVLIDVQGQIRGRAPIIGNKFASLMDSVGLMVRAHAAVTLKATDPEKSGGRIPTAQALLEQRKYHEARAEATEAAKENPGNAEAWHLLGTTAASVAKASEVRDWMCAIAATPEPQNAGDQPGSASAVRWMRLGDALVAAKREEEALFCYRQSMTLERTATLPGLKAARLALKRKDKGGALCDINEVLRRDFANPEALQVRASILPASLLKPK